MSVRGAITSVKLGDKSGAEVPLTSRLAGLGAGQRQLRSSGCTKVHRESYNIHIPYQNWRIFSAMRGHNSWRLIYFEVSKVWGTAVPWWMRLYRSFSASGSRDKMSRASLLVFLSLMMMMVMRKMMKMLLLMLTWTSLVAQMTCTVTLIVRALSMTTDYHTEETA